MLYTSESFHTLSWWSLIFGGKVVTVCFGCVLDAIVWLKADFSFAKNGEFWFPKFMPKDMKFEYRFFPDIYIFERLRGRDDNC